VINRYRHQYRDTRVKRWPIDKLL